MENFTPKSQKEYTLFSNVHGTFSKTYPLKTHPLKTQNERKISHTFSNSESRHE